MYVRARRKDTKKTLKSKKFQSVIPPELTYETLTEKIRTNGLNGTAKEMQSSAGTMKLWLARLEGASKI